MKSVDRNLYDRNGYLYYRIALPRNIHTILKMSEIRISLATKDLGIARISAAQLDFEILTKIRLFSDNLRAGHNEDQVDKAVSGFKQEISNIKNNAGYNPFRNIKGLSVVKRKPLFSEISQAYLDDCPLDAISTKFYKQSTFILFRELIGDKVFQEINIEDAQKFKGFLLKIPANAKKKYKINSFENFDWNLIKDIKPQHPRTINNRLINMSALMNWAESRGYVHQAKNPFQNMTIRLQHKAQNRRHPFKPEELQTLFSSPIFTGAKGLKPRERFVSGDIMTKDSLYWIPLIGLYSGMRLNEICQLYVSDIRTENNVLIFDINADAEDKVLKTAQSKRYVPIHDALLQSGFMDYVGQIKAQGEVRLFFDVPLGLSTKNYSSTFTKRFWRVLKALELKRDGLCFHSLRHTFIDGMRNCGVERSIVMAITGHQSSKDVHDSYGYGYNLERLKQSINKLTFFEIEGDVI